MKQATSVIFPSVTAELATHKQSDDPVVEIVVSNDQHATETVLSREAATTLFHRLNYILFIDTK